MSDIVNMLSNEIDKALAEDIVASFRDIQAKYQIDEFKELAKEAGNFGEGMLMALWYLNSQKTFPTGIHFDSEKVKLENNKIVNQSATKDELLRDEIIRMIIPRILHGIYTLRNKKQAAHLRGTIIDQIDATTIVQSCNWALAELLWLCTKSTDKEALKLIQEISKIPPKRIEIFEDEMIIDTSDMKPVESLLYLVQKVGGKMIDTEAMEVLSKSYSPNLKSPYNARNTAIKKGWLFRSKTNLLHIRAAGRKELRNVTLRIG